MLSFSCLEPGRLLQPRSTGAPCSGVSKQALSSPTFLASTSDSKSRKYDHEFRTSPALSMLRSCGAVGLRSESPACHSSAPISTFVVIASRASHGSPVVGQATTSSSSMRRTLPGSCACCSLEARGAAANRRSRRGRHTDALRAQTRRHATRRANCASEHRGSFPTTSTPQLVQQSTVSLPTHSVVMPKARTNQSSSSKPQPYAASASAGGGGLGKEGEPDTTMQQFEATLASVQSSMDKKNKMVEELTQALGNRVSQREHFKALSVRLTEENATLREQLAVANQGEPRVDVSLSGSKATHTSSSLQPPLWLSVLSSARTRPTRMFPKRSEAARLARRRLQTRQCQQPRLRHPRALW